MGVNNQFADALHYPSPRLISLARLPPALLRRLALRRDHERPLEAVEVHAAGKASRYTRSRLPVRLAYAEPQPTKSRALKREAAIKKLRRPQ